MAEWGSLGKVLLIVGLCIALAGLLPLIIDRVPGAGSLLGWFGKLPGGISIQRDSFSFSFPLATSLLLSILLSLVFFLVSWIFRR